MNCCQKLKAGAGIYRSILHTTIEFEKKTWKDWKKWLAGHVFYAREKCRLLVVGLLEWAIRFRRILRVVQKLLGFQGSHPQRSATDGQDLDVGYIIIHFHFRHFLWVQKWTIWLIDSFVVICSGCGNSSLSEDMYRDGFHNITNVDYSTVVVENMKNRSEEARSMQWLVMDIKDMKKFESGSFDIVIEKATLDALLVGERDPWRLSDESRTLMDDILIQVSSSQ